MSTIAQLPIAQRQPGGFTRLAQLLAKHRGDYMGVLSDVEDSIELTRVTKAAIEAGTTSTANWAGETVDFRRLSGEFAARLRPATILGRLRGVRTVPPNTRTLLESSGTTSGWVSENEPTPLSQFDLDDVSLGMAKLQTAIVITAELAKVGDAAALATLEQLMIRSLASALDVAFIDPTASAGAGPASVTYAASGNSSTGASTAQVTADLKAMVQQLLDAGSDLSNATWVLHPRTALAISLLENTAGAYAFPGLTAVGGSLLGLPAITSAAIPVDTGNDTYLCLIDGSRILLADSGLAAVDVSRQSSVQMLTNPSTGAVQQVSLWQNNLVGIRLTRWIGWKVLDSSAIAVLEDVAL